MSFTALLLLALSVSMDNFAVSMALGSSSDVRAPWPMFRLAAAFGIFQFGMALLGWFGGSQIAFLFHGYERWVMFGSLAIVGWCMLRSAKESEDVQSETLSSMSMVLSLAFATSVDSLAIGLGLAMMQVNILQVSAVIGICATCLSFAGLLLGGRLGQTMGQRSKYAGGLALLMLGLRAFVQ
jgi:putative Mn2+ efflux pump MntP